MSDEVQGQLRAWVLKGDRRSGEEAVDAIAREWRPRVRYFLQNPSEDEVEELLADALCTLCVAAPGKLPRAMAPEHVESPAAWRRQVLKHFLIDRLRRQGRRRHAELGELLGLSPETEAEAWREDRGRLSQEAKRRQEAPAGTPPLPELVSPDDGVELGQLRHRLMEVLPKINPRYGVVLMLALGMDPSPFVPKLATLLKEDEATLLHRVQVALSAPAEGGSEYLSLAKMRVLWPTEPEANARESARKNLERGIKNLISQLRLSA